MLLLSVCVVGNNDDCLEITIKWRYRHTSTILKKKGRKLENKMVGMENWKNSLSMKGYFVVINGEDHITYRGCPFTALFVEKSGLC